MSGDINISATGNGSVAMGNVVNSGEIKASNNGSIAMGSNQAGYLESLGSGSIAMGYASGNILRANGNGAVSIGYNTKAFGNGAVALGYDTNATGQGSFASGDGTIASGVGSTAMGDSTTASGVDSFATGNGTTASGSYSIATGYDTTASGGPSTAMGKGTIASGAGSTSIGYIDMGTLIASGTGSVAMGYALMVGNAGNILSSGTGSFAGGYVYGGANEEFLESSANGSFAFGYGKAGSIQSLGGGSVAMGYSDANLAATGTGAVALGYNVQSLAEASVCLGKDLTNYNANSVLVQDLNVLGDGNFVNVGVSNYLFVDQGKVSITGPEQESFSSGFVFQVIGGEKVVSITAYKGQGIELKAGQGSTSPSAPPAGDGGNISIEAGQGGLTGGSGGSGGDVNINAGPKGRPVATAGNIYLGGSNGNVRIGSNATPTVELDVAGSINVTGDSNFLGNLMITGTSFASSHVDHTPGWEGSSQEALKQLLLVETGSDGELVHSSLPEFTRVKLPYTKPGKESKADQRGDPMKATAMTTSAVTESSGETEIDEATTGRDLGATITMLTEAVKALDEQNNALKQELCSKDRSYSWCEGKPKKTPVEEPPVEEPQVEELSVEEPPVEESPVEEPLAEEPSVEEPSVEEPPVEESPVEEPPVEECSIVCSSDGECDDADGNTLDVCNNDGSCDSSCTNLPVVFNARAIWNGWFG